MHSRGRSSEALFRALTALVVGVLATLAALHLFIRPEAQPAPPLTDNLPAGQTDTPTFEVPETADPAPASITISFTLDRTAPVSEYLQDAGIDRDEARRWGFVFQSVAATRLLSRDHPLTLYKDPETGELRGLKYDIDLKTSVTVANLGNMVIKAATQPIEYYIKPVQMAFEVKEDFKRTAARHGVPSPIVESLLDAFSDRHALEQLKPGSGVKLIYQEKISRDGTYHPLLHTYRPHVGVDLVAQYGTPVKAVADGRVEQAGWAGELGNAIRIEHQRGMVSIYGHLSRISPDVHPDAWVHMGQVIGWVGSTGLSTGPHLHFALEKEGNYVNPLTEKIGVNHQVSPRMRALFDNLRQRYEMALAKLPDFGGHFAPVAGREHEAHSNGYHLTLGRSRRHSRRASLRQTSDSTPSASGADEGAM